jgi:hypothetical protein
LRIVPGEGSTATLPPSQSGTHRGLTHRWWVGVLPLRCRQRGKPQFAGRGSWSQSANRGLPWRRQLDLTPDVTQKTSGERGSCTPVGHRYMSIKPLQMGRWCDSSRIRPESASRGNGAGNDVCGRPRATRRWTRDGAGARGTGPRCDRDRRRPRPRRSTRSALSERPSSPYPGVRGPRA